jgi:hypothetical protein
MFMSPTFAGSMGLAMQLTTIGGWNKLMKYALGQKSCAESARGDKLEYINGRPINEIAIQ